MFLGSDLTSSGDGFKERGHSCDFSANDCWDYGRFAESSDFTWKRIQVDYFSEATDNDGVGFRKGLKQSCFSLSLNLSPGF